MKKILFIVVLAIACQFAMAQDMKRQDANNYQRQAQQLIESADEYKVMNKVEKAAKQMKNAAILMQKAKDAIDAVAVNETTANQAKTWHYYTVIYYKIGAYPEFFEIDNDAYSKALSGIQKLQEVDAKYYQDNRYELESYINAIGNSYYQLGVDSFNNANYEDAMVNFQKAADAKAKIGGVDDAALVNLALCASKVSKFDVAASTYATLIEKGFEDATIYSGLVNAYRELGEGEKGIEIINVARQKYPEDPQLVNDMINIYLSLHREAEITDQIEAMAQKYSDQPVYYFILGTIFGNKESVIYDMDKALGYYESAIKVDEKYADAYYNAGALLIEKASEYYKEANDKDPSEYSNFNAYIKATDELTATGKSFDERALPYVEKTYELLPDDNAVKQALKGIYTRLKMNDKAAALGI